MNRNVQREQPESRDPGDTSRGWPIGDHVGEVRLDHILVVVDESTLLAEDPVRTPLLGRLAAAATTLNCRVTLYAPCAETNLARALFRPDDTLDEQQALDLAATRMSELVSWLQLQGVVSVETRVIWEPLEVDVLLRRSRELEADMIMKTGTAERYLIGLMMHTDWALLRSAPIPVWFVMGPEERPLLRNVVTAVGSSDRPEDVIGAHDYDVCALANLIAAKNSAGNTIVHTYQTPQRLLPAGAAGAAYAPEAAALPPGPLPQDLYRQREVARHHAETMDAFARFFHIEPDRIILRPGRLDTVIADVAESTAADLVVMGSRNLTRWQRVLRPVNAEAVLAEAPCDVLILPEVTAQRPDDEAERPPIEGSPHFDLEAAIVNPEAVFGTPQGLLDHPALSPALRLRLLKIWESDVRSEMVEEEEGGPVGPSRADQLQKIHQARQRLAQRRG